MENLKRIKKRNNIKSVLLLLSFPTLILIAVFLIVFYQNNQDYQRTMIQFLKLTPIVILSTSIWFIVAYFSHVAIIKATTNSKPIERSDNQRLYDLTEKLCAKAKMPMPFINIIDSSKLNAFASGINQKTYAISFSQGLLDELSDEELEGVIAHELIHIKNNDVRLAIISIIFVGIFSFILEILLRSFLFGSVLKKSNKSGGFLLFTFVITVCIYLLSSLFKFALSRNREYVADAEGVELTQKPHVFAQALRKIARNHNLMVQAADIKELFIVNNPRNTGDLRSIMNSLFSSHPPIKTRISILEKVKKH